MARGAAFVVALLGSAIARASAPELFGLGAEESGVGSASAARVHDFSSLHYDPAGLARLEHPEASFGVIGFGSALRAGDGAHAGRPIADPFGVVIGAAAPVPLGGALAGRLFVGVALHVLPGAIVRVISRPPDEPFFPYYDNRTQRLVVLPGLAARVWRNLSVGVGWNYLAGLGGQVRASEGATRSVEPRVDEAIFSTVRVNAGLLWRSRATDERLALAFTYRQAFAVPYTTSTKNRVAGQPIDLDVDAEGLFTPHTFVVAAAARPRRWLLVSLDLSLALWSRWRGPYVTVDSTLPIAGSLSAPPPQLDYSDAWGARAGVEARRDLSPRLVGILRGGYGFESSPIPADQPGVTNLLDGHKHLLSLGAGLRARLDGGDRPVLLRLDGSGQLQLLEPRTIVKRIVAAGAAPTSGLRDELPDDPRDPATLGVQVSNPGWPSIRSGGFVWAAQITLTVER